MANIVEIYETFYPAAIGLFGSAAVMARTQPFSKLI